MRKALYTEHGIKKRNIALIGFMGTGKSEVVYRLEEKTGMLSFDVDKEIEGKTGCLIREIFEHKGERAFRRMERGEIEKIKGISNAVIATGGGAVLSRMNRNILKKNCIVIWLWANRDTILKRVDGNGIRPLLNVKNKRRQIERILKVRVPLYAHASDLLIRADERSPEEIAERIYNESNKSFKN
jgi:shikimate kinase